MRLVPGLQLLAGSSSAAMTAQNATKAKVITTMDFILLMRRYNVFKHFWHNLRQCGRKFTTALLYITAEKAL
jgi:hypothetical protein